MEKKLSYWGDGELVFSAPKALAVNFGAEAQDFSAAFDDFSLEMQQGTGPMQLTQVASIRVPITVEADQILVGYHHSILVQFHQGTPGIRALVVADFAGTLHSVEFEFLTPHTPVPGGSFTIRQWSPFSVQGQEINVPAGLTGPVPDYQASIMVTLQRRNPTDHGSISIDPINVVPAIFPPTVFS